MSDFWTTSTSPSALRTRISGRGWPPRSIRSTVLVTSWWIASLSTSMISMITSNVGGALRSRTVFCVPRRLASSSDSVTAWMPPTRSERVGFISRFSSELPCAVPTSWTPRSAMVRAANASCSTPISSMTTTSGMWFSTASIITACWSSGVVDLHPAGAADRRVRDVAVAGDLVGRVHDDDALLELVGQDAGDFAQLGGLAPARTAQHQDALAGLDDVADDVDGAVDGAPDAAGQADDLALAVADGRDAVQRPLDAGAVVLAERADAGGDVLDVFVGDGDAFAQPDDAAVGEARLGVAAQVHDDLDQALRDGRPCSSARAQRRRQDLQKLGQVVRDAQLVRRQRRRLAGRPGRLIGGAVGVAQGFVSFGLLFRRVDDVVRVSVIDFNGRIVRSFPRD